MPSNRENHYRINARDEDRQMLLNLSYPPDIELFDIREFPEMEDSTSIFLKNLADTGVFDGTLREEIISLLGEHGYELEHMWERYGEVVTKNPVFVYQYKTRISQKTDSIFKSMNDFLSSEQLLDYQYQVRPIDWKREMERLENWAFSIGVYDTDQASLINCLPDASDIKDRIIRQLTTLESWIEGIQDIITKGIERDFTSDLETGLHGKSEMMKVHGGLANTVSCLWDLAESMHSRSDNIPTQKSISQQIDSILKEMDDTVFSKQYLPYESYVASEVWKGEMGRFRVWSNNIEAQTGQESLEHRLRDASYITEQINRLLRCLKNYNDDIRVIINGGDTDDLGLDVLGKEIEKIYGAFDEAVGGLNRMSLIIQDRAH